MDKKSSSDDIINCMDVKFDYLLTMFVFYLTTNEKL